MIKRVNFTGRRRIPRDRIEIEIQDGKPRMFTAKIDLNDSDMPIHAAVCLEAMCAGSNVIERFECGTVANLSPIINFPLREVEGENVFFTLKVIDRTERFGRLLGIAENVRPERSGSPAAAGRRGILPIEPAELGDEIWRLEFKEQDVYLLINNQIPGLIDRARSDALFFGLIYPEVIRSILYRAFRDNVDPQEQSERWQVLWLRFGVQLHSEHAVPPKYDEDEEIDDWIQDIVEAFCQSHKLKARYATALLGAEGGES